MLNDASPVLPDGLTEEEETLFRPAPALTTVEEKLAAWVARGTMTYEVAVIYDRNILKVVTRGKAASKLDNATAPVTEADLDKANTDRSNLVVTHNHPGSSPLSRGDVSLAIGRGVKAVRAVGRHGTFAFERRGADWGSLTPEAVLEAYSKTGGEAWKAACRTFLEGDKAWNAGQLRKEDYRPADYEASQVGPTFAEDLFMGKHYACKALAEAHPTVVSYTHPPEDSLIAERLRLYELRIYHGADKRVGSGVDL